MLKLWCTTPIVNRVIDKIIRNTYINHDDFFINRDLSKVPVLNGILDIHTKKLEPFSDKYRFFYRLPIYYDPIVDCKEVKKFFSDILKDDDDLNAVQELFGFILYRDYKFEKSFMLLGGGRNGKTKTLELTKRFVGMENVSSLSLQMMENENNFLISSLHNKLVNISGDLSKTGLKQTGMFKKLVGRDTIQADRKFMSSIKFTNYAKLMFATNDLPYNYDDTDGFWDKWVILDFPYKFVTKPEAKNERLIDPEIIDKISTSKELSGLLNWALEGLDRLFKQNDFTVSETTQHIKTKWKRMSSSADSFIQDHIRNDFDYNSYIVLSDLKQEYQLYCIKHKIKPESPNAMNTKLNIFGGVQKQKKVNGINIKIWSGIKINYEYKKLETEEEELIFE